MRWPLRNQILLPMVCVMLAALTAVSLLNASMTARRARTRIERELKEAAGTLADADFPLNDNVLVKMRGLSGAEFAVIDRSGSVIASSSRQLLFQQLKNLPTRNTTELGEPVALGQRTFYHATLDLKHRFASDRPAALHILYPEESYREAWRDAVYPPLVVGAAALALVVILGLGMASRVTHPLGRLQEQAEQIAEGDFRAVHVPARNDEIADLSRSINRMAQMLARYEMEVRQNERLCTLGQVGSGIAHQLRNSVTGCRLAIQLHARACAGRDDETLEVANRQLELMEKYLQRFLCLGQNGDKPYAAVDLVPIVKSVVSLVGPNADHVNVTLHAELPAERVGVLGDGDALEQLVVNLLVNAIQAAAQDQEKLDMSGAAAAPIPQTAQAVIVSLRCENDRAVLEVSDSGGGPPAMVAANLFDAFVTSKPEGTGLGLWVAQRIAKAHGGEITWQRRDALTCFVVAIPLADAKETDRRAPTTSLPAAITNWETTRVETAGC